MIVLAVAVGYLAWRMPGANPVRALGLGDYVAYWSAGRLNAWGGNPYSPAELLPIQKEIGWPEEWPNIMYYPPWTLALVTPFGVLPFWVSRAVWLLFNFVIVLWCGSRLWRFFGGTSEMGFLALLIGLSFVPTLIALRMGQISPVLLLGVVGFLEAERRCWDWLAGAMLVVAAIKPQLLYLFGLAVLTWAIDQRRWRILLGGLTAAAAAVALAWWRNPHVIGQYGYALQNPPSGNITPTVGAMLRLVFGPEHTWLQFVPTMLGLAWFPFYWRKWRARWRWDDQAGVLLLASFVTSAYGSWVFDLVVLLVPLVEAAARLSRGAAPGLLMAAIAAYVAIDVATLALNLTGATYPTFLWVAPALWLGYWMIERQSRLELRPA
jgi:hypothetical protein